jgi:sugar lactone lactonase YvrE
MRFRRLVCIAAGLMLATVSAHAQEVTVVSDVLGPEGPLFVDGNLYYVAWTTGALSKWDGKTSTVLNSLPGCSHNGLALTQRKTFLLACTDEHGAILELDLTGRQLRRWDADDKGHKFEGGINDVVVTANGGAYATVFGPYQGVPTAVAGKILYLAPGSQQWVEVANDLNYANGIGVSPDQGTLYVSETVGNCILKFTINADGSLGQRFVVAGTGQHETRRQGQHLRCPVVRREGPEDLSRREAAARLPNRGRRRHDQRRIRTRRKGSVRHGSEGSERPAGQGQHRENPQC